MPHYYFHIHDNGVLLEDTEGIELADDDAVREECREVILSVLQEVFPGGWVSNNRHFQIVDEHGVTVLVLPFGSANERESSLASARE